MRVFAKTVLRTTAIALGYLALVIGPTPARAECYDDHKCVEGEVEDICYYKESTTQGTHCHLDHGVCSVYSGDCEPVEG